MAKSRGHSAASDPLGARPVIAIVGAGAVGGYYGARLAQHGNDVHFLLRRDYEAVRTTGWRVKSCAGDFTVPPEKMHVYNDPARMPPADLVIVTLKATSNDALQTLVAPLLHERTVLLTLQNGLGNEDHLAALFGAQRVLGGMAFVCINRTGPGAVHHMDHGLLKIGEIDPALGVTPRVESVAALFRSSQIDCDVLPDLRRGRWEKLVWNIPFNGLGTMLDWTTDRLIATEEGRRLVGTIMREVIAAAQADGATFALSPDEIVQQQIAFTQTMGAYQTSMQIDRSAGRPLEVEAILGEPLRRAVRLGVDTPNLEILYRVVKMLDPAHAEAP